MKIQRFTPVGVLALLLMAVSGQQLIFEIFELAPPPTWMLCLNLGLGLAGFIIDAVIIGIDDAFHKK